MTADGPSPRPPGFIEKAEAIKVRGVDEIVATGVNDVFVMAAWAQATNGSGKVTYLADGRVSSSSGKHTVVFGHRMLASAVGAYESRTIQNNIAIAL